MKRLLVLVGLISLCIGGAFAYTPSATLEAQLEEVAEKIDVIIDRKGDAYRSNFLNLILSYQDKYTDNERAIYILTYLYDYLSASDESELSLDSIITGGIMSADSQYKGSYTISDATYGTEVEVVVSGDTRTMTSNALANHATGEFPTEGNPNTISEQDTTREFTTNPVYTGDASWMRESGVAYNGVKFELETAESVSCDSGESYRIEAQQTAFNLGLDYNNAHVQPTGEYHYHGVSDLLMDTLDGDDLVHVGYATDGFPIYYSKEMSYTPSYQLKTDDREGTSCTYRDADVTVAGTTPDGTYGSDWEYVEGLGNLDSCNGATVNGEYVYFMTEAFPFGPRCSNGESSGQGGQGGGQGGPGGGQGGEGAERMGPPPGR